MESNANNDSPLLRSRVLVLNRSYLPINITNARRAFCMIYCGLAQAVDEEYRTFDFEGWRDIGGSHGDRVGMVSGHIRVPRVILVVTFDEIPTRQVKFNRNNIIARDNWTCQYCAKVCTKSELNLDHVVPRSQGGQTTWENIVCSCYGCNTKKGGKTPKQAGMKLLKKPRKPAWIHAMHKMMATVIYQEWKPFLSPLHG